MTTVKVEAAELIPEWATAITRMESGQLEKVIENLSLVNSGERDERPSIEIDLDDGTREALGESGSCGWRRCPCWR
ncbi:MAG: hypothetical protein M9896_13945 [Candidatus Promineofilum sp.]|uniref:hypothetical protein n=1 Tax=Promineifilum sp. TaxID=2664178 RepID=UPI002411F036|nr:hypothetical protein [Promineifilum sp.]